MAARYPESVGCPMCEGRGVVEYADVYSQPNGPAEVAWELSGIVKCGCRYVKGAK